MNSQQLHELPKETALHLMDKMNREHPEDVLLWARVYGSQNTARSARLIGIDREGMDLELEFEGTTPKRLNIMFGQPLDKDDEAEHRLEELSHKAHDLAGDNTRTIIGQSISKHISRWLGWQGH